MNGSRKIINIFQQVTVEKLARYGYSQISFHRLKRRQKVLKGSAIFLSQDMMKLETITNDTFSFPYWIS